MLLKKLDDLVISDIPNSSWLCSVGLAFQATIVFLPQVIWGMLIVPVGTALISLILTLAVCLLEIVEFIVSTTFHGLLGRLDIIIVVEPPVDDGESQQ